ncbi:MAG TPA: GNAT family N-acetyltransferase [Acidobacteriaceae bacterium]|nr:GNAT family N-acetyltransferase [Acidobacteriaceae bacterium]
MTAGFEIRPAALSDLGAIFALERAVPTAPHWPRGAYDTILAADIFSPRRCLLAALAEGELQILGFAVGIVHPAGDSELESVAVAESARRRGIGKALCLGVAEWCRQQGSRELLLEVRSSSAGAIALYAGLGFACVGRRSRYYRHPDDDALVMRLLLEPDLSGVCGEEAIR